MSGITICRASNPVSGTDTVSTAPTTRTGDCAATRTSCCSTPYAYAIEGNIDSDESLFSYWLKSPNDNSAMNTLDSAGHTMKSVVVNPYFDWGADRHPNIPTMIRSFTRLMCAA